jgi:hypothetical protein
LGCSCELAWKEELLLEQTLPAPLGISKHRRGNLLNRLRSL